MLTYDEIGSALQINKGVITVNHDVLGDFVDEDVKYLNVDEGIKLFNKVAVESGLSDIKDPKGYMCSRNSVRDYLSESYNKRYSELFEATKPTNDIDGQDSVEGREIMGANVAIRNVLERLEAQGNKMTVIRNDMKEFLPVGVKFGDLRFMDTTPAINQKIDKMVMYRSGMTIERNMKRQLSDERRQKTVDRFRKAGLSLKGELEKELGMVRNNNNEIVM